MWTKDKSSSEVVHNAWQIEVKGFHSYKLARKQDATKREIRRWNKTSFGHVQERIKAFENRLAKIQNVDPSKENLEMEVSLNLELDGWKTRNEIKWNKKSRELWIRAGDRNTKFFQLSTLKRRRRNNILEIKLDDGIWINNMESVWGKNPRPKG